MGRQTTDKEKYVWLHESTPIQQSRSKAKYDKALKVGSSLQKIRDRVLRDLDSRDERLRQVATVCYLIDTMGMRVGDEKDEDEADTVGASTLRVEHVSLEGNRAEFNFLGKDSVAWSKSENVPPSVAKNLKDFTKGKRREEEIFRNVGPQSGEPVPLFHCEGGVSEGLQDLSRHGDSQGGARL